MKRFFLFISFICVYQVYSASAEHQYYNLSGNKALEVYLKNHKIDDESDESLTPEVEAFANLKNQEYQEKKLSIDQWGNNLVKGYDSEGFQNNHFSESEEKSKFFHPEGLYSLENIQNVAKKVRESFEGRRTSLEYLKLLLSNIENMNYTIQVMKNLGGLDEKPNPDYEKYRVRYDSKDLHRTILRLMIEQQLIREFLGEDAKSRLNDLGKINVSNHYKYLDDYWDESVYQYVLDGVRQQISLVNQSYQERLEKKRSAFHAELKKDLERRLLNAQDPEEIQRLSRELDSFENYAVPTKENLKIYSTSLSID